MLFTIVENFSSKSGESWKTYCEWRGITFDRFDSLDRMMRPSLFDPVSTEDWDNVACENFMVNFITNLDYARRKLEDLGSGVIVGFSLLEHDECDPGFLGYDIIDGYYDISLLTNWGDDFSAANSAIASNGLIATRESADHVFAELDRLSPEDPHVEGCQIISVYSTAHITN